MRLRSLALCALALAVAFPAAAQMQSGGVARVYVNKVKPGMNQQYEAGRKKHMAWHRAQKDAWTWHAWEVISGPGTGLYVIGTFGHNWKDFDGREKFDASDSADALANMGATEESSYPGYYLFRPELSLAAENPGSTPLLQVTHFYLTAEGVPDFIAGIRKINEAIKKANWPSRSLWYQLVNGGEGPRMVLVQPRATWAEFQPPEKTLDAMVQEVHGNQGETILRTLRRAVRYTVTETLQYRPDLGYAPGTTRASAQ